MPKLPAVKPRRVIRFLEQNGFVLDHSSGSHFVYYHPVSRRLREAGFTREDLIAFLTKG